MPKRARFTLSFAPEAVEHLDSIEPKHHGLLRREIREQLSHTPTDETRNRKPLEQPAPYDASWELRCGPDNRFRVFYDADVEAGTVSILAIGVKDRNRLFVGGEEYTMKIAPLADVKARLSEYLYECETQGPIVITRNGKAVAVLLAPNDDDDLERLLLSRSTRFQAMLNRSRKSLNAGKGLSESAFWKAVGERTKRRRSKPD
ncbi:MAG: type II toxin-antitoxin system Phd/YefM family antitoxin [Gemmataceae bacterium]|nr:type II toxin-antitoxin system Phd/YefM family antitoxin [Gemmataceae bacterium]